MLRCVHSELGDHPIAFQRSDDEEEQQRGEEWHGEETENVGEGPNEKKDESEKEDKVEHVTT
jgi:hypothetical protein